MNFVKNDMCAAVPRTKPATMAGMRETSSNRTRMQCAYQAGKRERCRWADVAKSDDEGGDDWDDEDAFVLLDLQHASHFDLQAFQ